MLSGYQGMRTSAASALRRLTPLLLLFFTSLGACRHTGCGSSQAAKTRLDDAHDTFVSDPSAAKLKLKAACVWGLQSSGQKTNDVYFSGSTRPILTTRGIRDGVLGAAKDGIVPPGAKVSLPFAPGATPCLYVAMRAGCEPCFRHVLQETSGAAPCAEDCWSSLQSTSVVTYRKRGIDSSARATPFSSSGSMDAGIS